ncbi:DUF6138 family protein [Saccharibacillus alkalitolerans]|uniref:Uncharacterized protein n=1 Tax=Saccharibacillus alkalitolerans TaxID=2705290 RepID=A0ABX0F8R3_9BACL|nr:DUF6138 family protein [Saccharibacillus alkalitolerans]NGZ74397.1 hypothetical protein [Saccharibacillus alkalitolerans]
MNELSARLLREVWERLSDIYAKEKRQLDDVKDWSVLHPGAFGCLRIVRRIPKWGAPPVDLAIDVHEPLSWSDDAYTFELGPYIEELTDDMLVDEFWPALRQQLRTLLQSGEMGPHFFDYRFKLRFEFRRPDGGPALELEETLIDEERREKLRQALDGFIRDKVLSPPPARPKPKDEFFFARLLVNPDFLPEGSVAPDPNVIEPLLQAVSAKHQGHPERLNEWRRQYAWAFKEWAEEQFLPLYFLPLDSYAYRFELKPEAERPPVDDGRLDFFLYAAIRIGDTESDRRLDYLRYAAQLGSETAQRYLKAGSGSFESERRSDLFQGKANDVLQTIELKIASEEERAYREALEYVCDLLRQDFPKEYSLKLKSSEKRLLPMKKLAKSPLHRFFANALQYPGLFPLIAEYAELAMEEFAWYGDVEPGEKSVMPGTYAVLGLGLASTDYDPLLIRYMRLVDTEHQSAHDDYAAAFVQARGLDERTMPVFVAILLAGGQNARPLKDNPVATPELAKALIPLLTPLEDYERETVIHRLFGGEEKLARAAKKAEPEMKTALEALAAKNKGGTYLT